MNILFATILLIFSMSALYANNVIGKTTDHLCIGSHDVFFQESKQPRTLGGIALSNNGRRFAVAVDDRGWSDFFVFEVSTGKLLWKLALPHPASSVAFNAKANTLALSFTLLPIECPHVKLFNASNGAELALENPGSLILGDSVQVVNFSADGRLLAASLNAEIVVWDIATGRIVSEIEPPGFETRQGIDSPKELVFSPNGKYIAGISDRYPIVYLWNLKSRRLVRSFKLKKFSGVFETAVFSKDGSLIAVGTSGPLVIWNTRTGAVVTKIMRPTDGPIGPVTFMGPQKLVVSGVADLKVWDLSRRKPVPIQDLRPSGEVMDTVLPLSSGRLVGLISNGMWEKNPDKPLEIQLIEVPSGKVISTMQVPGRAPDSGRKDAEKPE